MKTCKECKKKKEHKDFLKGFLICTECVEKMNKTKQRNEEAGDLCGWDSELDALHEAWNRGYEFAKRSLKSMRMKSTEGKRR